MTLPVEQVPVCNKSQAQYNELTNSVYVMLVNWLEANFILLDIPCDQGGVSLTATDRPTGRRTILPCYLPIAEWSSPGRTVRHCQ